MNRIALHTLGCKLNYAESSLIGERLVNAGNEIVESDEQADVIIVNSCTVTSTADRECRQIVRRALRKNPDACVIVTGCYAQLKPEEIASIEGVDYVLGSSEKFRLLDLIPSFNKVSEPQVHVGDISDENDFGPAFNSEGDGRTRSFLKVQDGCDFNCSFCTIPLARGGSRSQSVADVVSQAVQLVSRGYKEIVLTGVNTGDYGKHIGSSLYDLLTQLHQVEGLKRLRISSIEPNLLTSEIIALTAESEIMMPHFHIPLQSGSDPVLAQMRRRYKSSLYRSRVEEILATMPAAGIGVDVIAGFPGETVENFAETVDFIEGLPIQYLHVFTYSERDNTPARGLHGKVDVNERRRRTRLLRELSRKKRSEFARQHEGTIRSVLLEGLRHDGTQGGYTDNYIRVELEGEPGEEGSIIPIAIGEWLGESARGRILDPANLIPEQPQLKFPG